MSTELSRVFEDSRFGQIRVVMRDGEPWFAGVDVARALGYADPTKAVLTHCKKVNKITEKGDSPVPVTVNWIAEGDVYRLVARSNLPSAEKFETWIFDEVLPSIRKTGGYGSIVLLPDFSNPAEAARAWADEYEKRILAEKQRDEAVETAAVAAAALGFAGDFVQVKGLSWVTKMFTPSGQFWSRLGKFIAKLSRETGAEVKQVVDPTFGYVNAYRREVCDQAQRYLAEHPEVFSEFRKNQ